MSHTAGTDLIENVHADGHEIDAEGFSIGDAALEARHTYSKRRLI